MRRCAHGPRPPRTPSIVPGVALLLVLAGPCAGQSFAVPAELWDRPRSGPQVIATAPVREAVARLAARADARLLIRHPRTPEAQLQAEELRAWLTAHAVEPARIELRADLAPRQPILMEVTP